MKEAKSPRRRVFVERDKKNKNDYGPDAPLSAALIFINPSVVKKAIRPRKSPRKKSGLIKGGDWDKKTIDLDSVKKVLGVRQHILDGMPWEKTAAWERCLEFIERGTGLDGIRTVEDIVRRYDNLEQFITNVRRYREAAYKTRLELDPDNFREFGGVMINIDRNGNLLFGSRGAHRLAIAQALGLTCMPAQLGMVHEDAVKNGLWRLNIIPEEQARSIRLAAQEAAQESPAKGKTADVRPTKQRYVGEQTSQSIEFNKNRSAHWSGQTVPKFERLIPIVPGDSIVEIGAAEGILSLTLAPHKKRVRAIDITPARHEKGLQLKARWIELGKPVDHCEMVLGDALKNPSLLAGFDTLVASRVIYYFGTYLDEFMDNVRKNVDNLCLIGNPNRAARFQEGKTGKLGEYARYTAVPGMMELVQRHGFKVTHIDESLDPLIVATKI